MIQPVKMGTEDKGAGKPSRLSFLNSDWLSGHFPFYYGWMMIPVAMLTQVTTSPGQTFGISIFNPSLQQALGINQSQLSGAYMFGTLLASIPQPFIGAQMDRFGIRRVLTMVTLSMGLACLLMSQVNALWMLFLAFLFLRLFGQGAMGLLASNIPAMWFHKRLGRVSGLISIGFSGSTALLPPVLLAMITNFGWRMAYVLLGVSVWIIMIPILITVFRNSPRDVNQHMDGITSGTGMDIHENASLDVGMDLKGAQRTPAYWIMLVLTVIWAMSITGVFFHIIPLFTSQGLTEAQATATYTILAITTVVTQLLAGFLADRIQLRWLISLGVSFLIGALVFLANLTSPWSGQVYAVLIGACQGVLGIVGGTLWARYYGLKHLGKIRGSIYTATVAGSSSGPFIMGIIFDAYGSYTISLWIFIILLIPLVVASIWAKEPIQLINRSS